MSALVIVADKVVLLAQRASIDPLSRSLHMTDNGRSARFFRSRRALNIITSVRMRTGVSKPNIALAARPACSIAFCQLSIRVPDGDFIER